jgi:hypothetical protein
LFDDLGMGVLEAPNDRRVGSSAHPVKRADLVAIEIA